MYFADKADFNHIILYSKYYAPYINIISYVLKSVHT